VNTLTLSPKDRAQLNFLRWLSVHDPKLYARVIEKNFKGSALGALGWFVALANAVVQVGGAVLQKKQSDKQFDLQKKTLAAQDAQAAAARSDQLKLALLDINQQRAAKGLNPVDINGNVISSQALPTPNALTPIVKAAGMDGATLAPWLIGGAVVLGGAFLVLRK
jgi:hypothetical protein